MPAKRVSEFGRARRRASPGTQGYDALHVYRVRAWRDTLGSRLVTVTWRVSRGERQ
jgi:hypothetical protein